MAARAGNRLLALVSEDAYWRLSLSFEIVPLEANQVLYKARSPIDYVYFPLNGIISTMIVMDDGNSIEVAAIGNEGMAGLTASVGGESSPHETTVQITGNAVRVPVGSFRQEISLLGSLQQIIIQYHSAFAVQRSYAVACNGLHTIDKRCCRWLLTTQDRMRSPRLNLTHEFLAIMLGVRRASISDVLAPMQKSGVISNDRGTIEILKRAAILEGSCECYSAVRDEFSRLLG